MSRRSGSRRPTSPHRAEGARAPRSTRRSRRRSRCRMLGASAVPAWVSPSLSSDCRERALAATEAGQAGDVERPDVELLVGAQDRALNDATADEWVNLVARLENRRGGDVCQFSILTCAAVTTWSRYQSNPRPPHLATRLYDVLVSVRPRVIYVHIGPPKTGTTYLQEVLWRTGTGSWARYRPTLAPRRGDHFHAALDLRGIAFGGHEDPQTVGAWDRLAAKAAAAKTSRAVVSMRCSPARTSADRQGGREFRRQRCACRVLRRDLARQLPALWQESLKNRHTPKLLAVPAPGSSRATTARRPGRGASKTPSARSAGGRASSAPTDPVVTCRRPAPPGRHCGAGFVTCSTSRPMASTWRSRGRTSRSVPSTPRCSGSSTPGLRRNCRGPSTSASSRPGSPGEPMPAHGSAAARTPEVPQFCSCPRRARPRGSGRIGLRDRRRARRPHSRRLSSGGWPACPRSRSRVRRWTCSRPC